MRRALLTVAVAASLALPARAEAGAWTKGFGELYAKIDAGAYVALRYVDPRTGESVDASYVGQRYGLYAEAGLLPWHPVQLSLSVPAFTVGTTSFGDERLFGPDERAVATSAWPGDLQVGLQVGLVKPASPFQLAASLQVKIPMYGNDQVGRRFGPWKDVFPLPGDGQVDVGGLLVAGASLPAPPGPLSPWLEGGVGYLHRSEAYVDYTTDRVLVDGVPAFLSFGLAGAKGYALIRADGHFNVAPDDDTREGIVVALQGGLGLGKGFSLEGRIAGEPWVRGASQGLSFGIGISWQGQAWQPPARASTSTAGLR
jgi:hypothetical protein